MDSITNPEIMEIITLLEASIDVQYQIWITVTFAFIVANYVSRGQLPKLVLLITIGLYASIVVALYFRWITDGIRASLLIEELSTRGIDFAGSGIAAAFRILTYTVGSFTAIFLAIYFDKKANEPVQDT